MGPNRFKWLLGVSVVVILGLLGCGGSGSVKIGVVAPLSGDMQSYGDSALKGAQLAADEIAAQGGLLTAKAIPVVSVDSAAGGDGVKKLVDEDKAYGVIVASGAADAIAAADKALPGTPAMKYFLQAYKTKYGAEPAHPAVAATAYDATFCLSMAVQKNGKARSKIMRDSLHVVVNAPGTVVGPADWSKAKSYFPYNKEVDYQGPTGAVEFGQDDVVTQSLGPWSVQYGDAMIATIPY